MKIAINEPLVKRNRTIGRTATFISLGVLALGLIITITTPAQILWAYAALLVGFLLSQIGLYFSARWGRSPRPDEILSAGLKGLDDQFLLFHYTTPASHLLLTPNCLWMFFPYSQKGHFSYDHNRYHHKGGSAYMKIFGQEGFGRPDLEIAGQMKDLTSFLKRNLEEKELPPVQPLLVFTNDDAEVDLENAPFPGIRLDKMKEYIRKRSKENNIPADKFAKLQQLFNS